MDFLTICQAVAADSGTIQGVLPTTVVGQTDRLGSIVRWTNEAYKSIQNAHKMWRWLQGEFYGDVTGAAQRYAGTHFTDFDTAATITRFSQWAVKRTGDDSSVSIYLTSTGVSGEGPMRWLDWETFRTTQLRGTQTPGPPRYFTIDPQNRLVVSPLPDATYTIKGPYRKSAQVLALDADTPEMPADFHDIIPAAALQLLGTFDESPQIPLWRLKQIPNFSMLEQQQLPEITWGGPLA